MIASKLHVIPDIGPVFGQLRHNLPGTEIEAGMTHELRITATLPLGSLIKGWRAISEELPVPMYVYIVTVCSGDLKDRQFVVEGKAFEQATRSPRV